MINAKFLGKNFKIYANGKIKCLEDCPDSDLFLLKDIVEMIDDMYDGPSDGFLFQEWLDYCQNME